jgi:ferredoxin-NADP reductase
LKKPVVRVRIAHIDELASHVKRLKLAPDNDDCLPPFVAGSHIQVAVPNLTDVKPAPFSLIGPPGESRCYEIVVYHTRRAGPVIRWLHDEARLGSLVSISLPRCGLELQLRATHHCLVAGGSGITAFFSHLEVLRRAGQGYQLHYTFKQRADGVWCNALLAEHNRHVRRYVSEEGERLDPTRVLSTQPPGAHVYVVGPPRLIQSVVDVARGNGFPRQAIHWDTYGWRPRVRADSESPKSKQDNCSARIP